MPVPLAEFFDPANPPFLLGNSTVLMPVLGKLMVEGNHEVADPIVAHAAFAMFQALHMQTLLNAESRVQYRLLMWMLSGDDAYVAETLRVAGDRLNDACAVAQWAVDSLYQSSPLWREAVDRIRSTASRN